MSEHVVRNCYYCLPLYFVILCFVLLSTGADMTSFLSRNPNLANISTATDNMLPSWDVHHVNEALQRFGWADYLVFILMLVICIVIGIYFGFVKVAKTESDYLVGGRNMSVFPVGLSLIASFVSGISLLGIPTEVYVYGIQYVYILIGVLIMGPIFQYIFLPVFMELQLTSTFEYLERRFSWPVRIFGSVLCVIGTFTWLPVVIYVPALAFNQVTGINVHLVTPIVCLVCIFYTSMGGLKAVVWTDVIQTVVMVGTMLLIAIKGTIDIGGIGNVIQRNLDSRRIEPPNFDPRPTTRHTFWSLVVGGMIYLLQTSAVNQPMIQRYLALPNLKEASKAVWIFVFGIITIVSTSCYCGMLIFATYYECDPITTKLAKQKDQLLPILVMDVVGSIPGIPGLFIAGIFSAALSSLSTGLNSLVAIVLEDFYRPFFKKELSERHKNIMMKITTVILGVIFVALVFVVENLGTVLQLTMSIGTISAGPSLALFTMGMVIPWINAKGALIGSISGLTFMSWLILSTQAAIGRGVIKYREKPVSVAGCQYYFNSHLVTPTPFSLQNSSTTPMSLDNILKKTVTIYESPYDDDVLDIYYISYLWYTLIGLAISCLIALLVSCLGVGGGPLDPRDVDPMLLTPLVRNRIKPRTFPNQPPAQDPIILAFGPEDYKISTISSNKELESYKNITSAL